jgi:hypothetical protein
MVNSGLDALDLVKCFWIKATLMTWIYSNECIELRNGSDRHLYFGGINLQP